MTNIFSKSYYVMKENIIILQPLLLGFLVFLFSADVLFAAPSPTFPYVFKLLTCFFTVTAFCAGWFACVKASVKTDLSKFTAPEEKFKKNTALLKTFFPGVAEYFLPGTGWLALYVLLVYATILLFQHTATTVFGTIEIPPEFLKILNTGSQADITAFLTANADKMPYQTIFYWGCTAMLFSALFSILMLWFAPALFFDSKNPIKALTKALAFTVKHLPTTILVLAVMFALHILIMIVELFTQNGFLSFIPFLLFFFYLDYYVTTVFLYYGQTCGYIDYGSERNG